MLRRSLAKNNKALMKPVGSKDRPTSSRIESHEIKRLLVCEKTLQPRRAGWISVFPVRHERYVDRGRVSRRVFCGRRVYSSRLTWCSNGAPSPFLGRKPSTSSRITPHSLPPSPSAHPMPPAASASPSTPTWAATAHSSPLPAKSSPSPRAILPNTGTARSKAPQSSLSISAHPPSPACFVRFSFPHRVFLLRKRETNGAPACHERRSSR